MFSPSDDGSDFDQDGICDAGDTCTDLDGDGLGSSDFDTGCPFPSLTTTMTTMFSFAWTPIPMAAMIVVPVRSIPSWTVPMVIKIQFCDAGDTYDLDGDGFGTGTLDNVGCLRPEIDINDSTPFACADVDGDSCDDCGEGWVILDGADADYDGICDQTDSCTDYDGDGLGNGNLNNAGCLVSVTDSNDSISTICADSDSDSCDDCQSGFFAPNNDGQDVDTDGVCDIGDFCIDLDQDGFGNGTGNNLDCAQSITDVADNDPNRATDFDADGCDDCRYGEFDPNNDGPDADNDGYCDDYDNCVDADENGLGNGTNNNSSCVQARDDFDDTDFYSCSDFDEDGCDDCSQGVLDWNNDGPDADNDGLCNSGDPCTDVDGDGVGSGTMGNVGCDYSIMDLDDYNAFMQRYR